MPEEHEYPTDEQLEKIENWDTIHGSIKELIGYVKELWWMPDWGFHLYRGKNIFGVSVRKLALHTGGWSGNESIIYSLQKNEMFWIQFWEKSVRGGHYWFEFYRGWK